jgi:uridylate kinase
MGGQIYLEWGRKLGVSEAVLSDVGRRTIDITAEILAEVLWSRTSGWADAGRPRAAPARSRAELLEYTATSRVVVMGCALEGAITSDSLAVLAAELLGFDVLSVKATGLAALGNASHVDPAHLLAEALVANDVERAGWHPSIDIWALRLLKRSDVRLSVIGVDDFVARRLESVVSVGG